MSKIKDDIFFYLFIGILSIGFLTGIGYLIYAFAVV
jgi:hypothetical protein